MKKTKGPKKLSGKENIDFLNKQSIVVRGDDSNMSMSTLKIQGDIVPEENSSFDQ